MDRARHGGHSNTMLLVCDANFLKLYNDHYGHAIGDRCLNRLAQLIISNLQPSQRLFRYGGEEFVLLVSGSAAEAQALAERLRSEVEHTQLIREAMITVSIGIATKYSQEKLRAWMRRADDAMYEAKQQGRNRCCVAT